MKSCKTLWSRDDRGSWGERQRAELFGSLIGRKVDLGEEVGNGVSDDDEAAPGTDALRLFG